MEVEQPTRRSRLTRRGTPVVEEPQEMEQPQDLEHEVGPVPPVQQQPAERNFTVSMNEEELRKEIDGLYADEEVNLALRVQEGRRKYEKLRQYLQLLNKQ